MRVRDATRQDLLDIGRVAESAHWDSYGGLIKPATIGALLQRDYSPGALRRRMLAGRMLVAETHEGDLVGFAAASIESGALVLSAISTSPAHRRLGIGRALVTQIHRAAPWLPVRADVILGHIEGEAFYETLRFAPGEVIHITIDDEDVIERRWWLPAADGVLGDHS